MSLDTLNLAPALSSLVLVLALTPLVRAGARRWGAVARPRADRWHRQPTALLGGLAIFPAVAFPSLLLLPHSNQTLAVFGAGALLWLLGLVDDLYRLRPYMKLVGQVVGAAVIVYNDLRLPWTPSPLLNMGLTILWLVGITNALNLLDNMDGLAAGVAAIASLFLGLNFLDNGQPVEAALVAAFAAALVGFLVFNSNPASIFMGDCGSLFIGMFLASTALVGVSGSRSRGGMLPVLAVPVLTLVIPIFDTTLVTIMRKLAGRAVSQGGRDHASHRLVAMGLSERRAVWMLYSLAALSGTLALLVSNLPLDLSLAAIMAFTVALTILGVYLGGVKVYGNGEPADSQPLVSFLVDLGCKRRIFEVLLDVALIILAYYSAHVLLFGPLEGTNVSEQFVHTLAVLVGVKLAAFLVTGVYRGLWRYISLDDALVYGRAVLLGSVASVVVLLYVFRFQGYSRAVFVLDGLLLLALLLASRLAFRVLRKLIPQAGPPVGRRALIYGAGDAGALLLRELRNNPERACVPVGFLDDDPNKKGRIIHGLRVLGGNGSMLSICAEQAAEEVLISSTSFTDERVREIRRDCEQQGIVLKRLRLEIEVIGDAQAAAS